MELIRENNNIYIAQIPKAEIEKIDFVLCKQPTETLESYYKRQNRKPDVEINGGFFDGGTSVGQTILTYRDEYQDISKEDWALYGFGVQGENQLIASNYNESFRDFICGYPPLLHEGKPIQSALGAELNYNARRSIMAYNASYVYLIAIDSPGMKYGPIQSFLQQLQIEEAINLDGGGSTRLLYKGTAYATAIYNRPVDNLIAVYLKPKPARIIYRVQLGAFSSKINANAFCNKIKGLGGMYTDAFVKYISPYYKVQVGAFSVKTNAENVLQDLKAKGYNAFITSEELK